MSFRSTFTPRFLGDNTTTVASVIQAEAGNQSVSGMVGVADVMQNRANSNFGGYGTSIIDQITAQGQFQSQSPVSQISPDAMATAQALTSGGLGDVTGGATYYANPSASSALWAKNLDNSNSLQIGQHFFTNNTDGTPFTPDYNTAAANLSPDATPTLNNTVDAAPASISDPAIVSQGATAAELTSSTKSAKAGQSAPAPKGGSQTVPQAIDAQTAAAALNTKASDSAVTGFAQSLVGAAKLLAQNTKNVTDKTQSTEKNIFSRGVMIAAGLAFLFGSLYLFGRDAVPSITKAV